MHHEFGWDHHLHDVTRIHPCIAWELGKTNKALDYYGFLVQCGIGKYIWNEDNATCNLLLQDFNCWIVLSKTLSSCFKSIWGEYNIAKNGSVALIHTLQKQISCRPLCRREIINYVDPSMQVNLFNGKEVVSQLF